MGEEKNQKGYNGVRSGEGIVFETPLKHRFEDTPERRAIDKLKQGDKLTSEEESLLLTTEQTAEVLTFLRGEEVTTRYIPQLVRNDRLQPAAPGSGRSYRYRLGDVRQVRFGKAGVPKKNRKMKTDA